VLALFEGASGLVANLSKSHVYIPSTAPTSRSPWPVLFSLALSPNSLVPTSEFLFPSKESLRRLFSHWSIRSRGLPLGKGDYSIVLVAWS
jgi:hypothetical protein